jgi:hypothetical protein
MGVKLKTFGNARSASIEDRLGKISLALMQATRQRCISRSLLRRPHQRLWKLQRPLGRNGLQSDRKGVLAVAVHRHLLHRTLPTLQKQRRGC